MKGNVTYICIGIIYGIGFNRTCFRIDNRNSNAVIARIPEVPLTSVKQVTAAVVYDPSKPVDVNHPVLFVAVLRRIRGRLGHLRLDFNLLRFIFGRLGRIG